MSKTILILGGTGYVGRQLIDSYYNDNTNIILYSRDEAKHWSIRQDFPSVNTVIGDIRDKDRLNEVITEFEPSLMIIASAMKHVPLCEEQPSESIQTNIIGVENAVSAALDRVETCLFVSSDKACLPINVYGMCKALAERIVSSAARHSNSTRFISVRFGNVLDSSGSVIPAFRKLAESGKNITVTSKHMTRFFMHVNDSVVLIRKAIELARSGEIFIPDLKAMCISDLAELYAELSNTRIDEIGIRLGEKMHEDLLSEEECRRVDRRHGYWVLHPIWSPKHNNHVLTKYCSDSHIISKDKLGSCLRKYGYLS